MKQLNFESEQGFHWQKLTEFDAVYLSLLYIGVNQYDESHRGERWCEVASSLGLPYMIVAQIPNIARTFECVKALSDNLTIGACVNGHSSASPTTEVLTEMIASYKDACTLLRLNPERVAKAWNKKLSLLSGELIEAYSDKLFGPFSDRAVP